MFRVSWSTDRVYPKSGGSSVCVGGGYVFKSQREEVWFAPGTYVPVAGALTLRKHSGSAGLSRSMGGDRPSAAPFPGEHPPSRHT